jgi:hypothetical protein
MAEENDARFICPRCHGANRVGAVLVWKKYGAAGKAVPSTRGFPQIGIEQTQT